VRDMCVKITKCSEDSFRVGKHGSTWDNSNKEDNAKWDNSKLKCRDKCIRKCVELIFAL
jgi:hypothetical protein